VSFVNKMHGNTKFKSPIGDVYSFDALTTERGQSLLDLLAEKVCHCCMAGLASGHHHEQPHQHEFCSGCLG